MGKVVLVIVWNKEHGFSLIESLLALTILFFIGAYLIPQMVNMSVAIERQKFEAHAAEVAFNGARAKRDLNQSSGYFTIDSTRFNWVYVDHEVCVTYRFNGELFKRCVSPE